MDNEKVVWVRCHGIPIHAWNTDFFESLAHKFGVFLGVDENTRRKTSLDVARIPIHMKSYGVFNMVIYAMINGSMFHIKILEEWCGPLHWSGLTHEKQIVEEEDSSENELESEEETVPPLFMAEDSGVNLSDEEEDVEDERFQNPKTFAIFEGKNVNSDVEVNDYAGCDALETNEDLSTQSDGRGS